MDQPTYPKGNPQMPPAPSLPDTLRALGLSADAILGADLDRIAAQWRADRLDDARLRARLGETAALLRADWHPERALPPMPDVLYRAPGPCWSRTGADGAWVIDPSDVPPPSAAARKRASRARAAARKVGVTERNVGERLTPGVTVVSGDIARQLGVAVIRMGEWD